MEKKAKSTSKRSKEPSKMKDLPVKSAGSVKGGSGLYQWQKASYDNPKI